jgi:predicted RNA-binding Zn ribbon-like protein
MTVKGRTRWMDDTTPRRSKPDVELTVVPMAVMRAARRSQAPPGATEFRYGAGSLCLDFAATLEGRGNEVVDLLSSTERLSEWLRGPELPLPAGGLTDGDLRAARELRSAVEGAVRSVIDGRPASAAEVRCINSCARLPTPVFLLRKGAQGRAALEEADLGAVLSVIARDAIHLLATTDRRRLRECAREGCCTLFFDRSPSGRRRWCSMKGCGEMVASASYRRRQTAGAPR